MKDGRREDHLQRVLCQCAQHVGLTSDQFPGPIGVPDLDESQQPRSVVRLQDRFAGGLAGGADPYDRVHPPSEHLAEVRLDRVRPVGDQQRTAEGGVPAGARHHPAGGEPVRQHRPRAETGVRWGDGRIQETEDLVEVT
jgi:hypothetical protein